MCKLTQNSPIQRGSWIFRIQGEDFTRGRENSGGLRPPLELCIVLDNSTYRAGYVLKHIFYVRKF